MDTTGTGDLKFGFRLDNAAKIFAAQHTPRRTTMFRVSATMDKPVKLSALQDAYQNMLDRCPYYKVQLRKGLFWYYLDSTSIDPRVEAESRYPCMYVPYKARGVVPFRVLAFRNRIAFEVAHFITDGTGALTFLNGLLMEYLRRCGEIISNNGSILDCNDPMDPLEFVESFSEHYQKGVPKAKRAGRALKLPGKALQAPIHYTIEGIMRSDDLKQQACRYGVTVGEFLTALLIKVCLEEMKDKNLQPKPIRISIPINLRRFFPSVTMRNFALAVEPGIDPRLGDFGLEDIIGKVHHFMRMELDHRYIQQQISRNITAERHILIRLIPLLLKDPIMSVLYFMFGRNVSTLSFSNIGKITIPEDMRRHITSYQLIPPPHHRNISATSATYNGICSFLFASTIEEVSLERRFFSSLRGMGIHVSIKTNRR